VAVSHRAEHLRLKIDLLTRPGAEWQGAGGIAP
jgi:hypothetical protein